MRSRKTTNRREEGRPRKNLVSEIQYTAQRRIQVNMKPNSGALRNWQERNEHLRDAVRECIKGMARGLYVYGPTGTGKTQTVEDIFAEYKVKYGYSSGGVTAQGFFELAEENAYQVMERGIANGQVTIRNGRNRHAVYDDCYSMLELRRVREYMLALLGKPRRGTRQQPDWPFCGLRETTYDRERLHVSVRFLKSLILISNVGLQSHKNSVMAALRARVRCIEHDPPNEELIAFIYFLCDHHESQGITAHEQREVAECMLEFCEEFKARPDLHLFCEQALSIFLSWKLKITKLHWKVRLRAIIQGQTLPLIAPPSRAELVAERTSACSSICRSASNREERLRLWGEATGLAPSTFYKYYHCIKPTGPNGIVES